MRPHALGIYSNLTLSYYHIKTFGFFSTKKFTIFASTIEKIKDQISVHEILTYYARTPRETKISVKIQRINV